MELVVGEENFESTRLSVRLPPSLSPFPPAAVRSLVRHLALAPPASKVSQLRNCHFATGEQIFLRESATPNCMGGLD